MLPPQSISRRDFLNQSLAVAGGCGMIASGAAGATSEAGGGGLPCGRIGTATISRVLLGGNLIAGYMHSRDLKYVNTLFRAYATDEKILETLALAEKHGINTVFETGGD